MKTTERIIYSYVYVERQTGRKYRIVKQYVTSGGKYAEGNQHKMYNLYKQYV